MTLVLLQAGPDCEGRSLGVMSACLMCPTPTDTSYLDLGVLLLLLLLLLLQCGLMAQNSGLITSYGPGAGHGHYKIQNCMK